MTIQSVSGPKKIVKMQQAIGRTKPATSGGHLVPFVRVATETGHVKALSKSSIATHISLPASRVARAEFLKKWAREQRRKVLAGGVAATLILPMLGAEAMAQSGSMTSLDELSGVSSAAVQPDGTLLIVMESGAQLIVPVGQFQLGEDGAIFISDAVVAAAVDANAGVESNVADAGGLLGAVGGLAALSLIGASSSSEASSSEASPSVTGFVVDGYISGATVFYDANNNGVLDDGETFTTTNASGSFELPAGIDAPIVALGGIDISTGLPSNLVLKAPAGSTVVSPLTTMVQQLVSQGDGTTVEAATASVLGALGLDPETDLLNVDPIADGNDALFAAGAQVAQFLALAEAAGLPAEAAADALAEALADPDVAEGLLSDADALNDVLVAANTAAGDGAVDLGSLAATITNSNTAINDAVASGENVQAAIADVQQAVMGNIADEIRNSDEAPREYTSDEIAEFVENAPEVGEDGTVIIDFTLSEDFSAEIMLADDQTAGAWYTDRQAPGAFVVDSERFEGESVLRQTIDSIESGTFAQTQGRKLDVPAGSTSVSIDLFVDPEWDTGGAQDGFRQAGFWTTTIGADGEVSGFPIIEFASLDDGPGFRVWNGAEFIDFPFEGEVPYDEFVTLSIELGSGGSVTYGVGDQTLVVEYSSIAESTIGNVILQTYNQTFDDDGDAVPNAARDEYSVYWDNLAADGGIVTEDTDVSIFGVVSFEPDLFEVASDATLTARMDQLDGVEIVGSGIVKLTGDFDADADLSGLLGTGVMIDATDVDGFMLALTPEQADGLQLDVASDAQISIDVVFNALSAEQGELEPQIDISGITVDGQQNVAAVFEVLSASGGFEDTMKLFWNAFDQAYYDDTPGGSLETNTSFVELANIYADYLADGGTPITDVVQTKVGGEPNFDARQQSLHDNILGNLQDGVIARRFGDDDPRNDNAKDFGDRPEVSGFVNGYAETFLAGAAWDLENGYIRPDVEVPNDTFSVLALDDLESGEGTAGTDIIFSAPTSNMIDISQGGADVILINADTVGRDGFTDQITGFDAAADGGDILQLVASGYASRGSELQLLEAGGSLNDDTSIGVYVTDADLSAVIADIDGEAADELEQEVLNFLEGFENDPDIDGLFIVATDGDDSILGRFELNDGDVEIAGLAYLDGVDGADLTIENFNLDNVFGVQDTSGAAATT